MTEMIEFFRETGREGGKKAATRMTKAARSERASKAAAARWAKEKKVKGAAVRKKNAGKKKSPKKGE